MDKLTSGTKVIEATFELRRGEVLGVAGLIGAGRTELLRLIAGADRPTAGSITLNGRKLTKHGTRAAIAAGIGLVPEERKREGIIPQRSVVNNIALPSMKHFAPRGFIRRRALRKEATAILTDINLRPLQIDRPIRLFSGGNQQKGIIARWIAAGCQILLFDEPTRGIDIGAKAEIYQLDRAPRRRRQVRHRRLLRTAGDHPARRPRARHAPGADRRSSLSARI